MEDDEDASPADDVSCALSLAAAVAAALSSP